jgi:RNA polymerase sigma-70 factor (ECF subfamily)
MIDTEIVETFEQDAEAVKAVRRGDAERYRELVERHGRRVFAVAWSRLGDVALAEEATQEAFIRAYQRLWLLGDGKKFSSWIAQIARNTAINLGLKHRRELDKRERWALEHEPKETVANEEPCTPEMLRQTLTELPAAHRECLVLFYLERKSGAEAATALGISEATLRVRLHRARAALRERLEEKLEGSLEKLRPANTLVPAVMAGVLASSSAKAATAGGAVALGAVAKVISFLGKSFLFSWLMPALTLIGNLPGMLLAWFMARQEQKNFRDTDGFRVRLHRQFFRSFLWGFPVLVLLIFGLQHLSNAAWGLRGMLLATAAFCGALMIVSARALIIGCNAWLISQFAYCAILTVGMFAQAMGWLPARLGMVPFALATVLFAFALRWRPARMDFNLFLRASEGLLNFTANADEKNFRESSNQHELLRFARFLGARYLVINFWREERGLRLLLPPVKSRFLVNMTRVLMPFSKTGSSIWIGTDGTVLAHCTESDRAGLAAADAGREVEPKELELTVAAAVNAAWRNFRSSDLAAAERVLGQVAENEVFVVPPSRGGLAKARWPLIIYSLFLLFSILGIQLPGCRAIFARLDGLKPVAITEAQVREFMSLVNTNPNPLVPTMIGGEKGFTKKGFAWDPSMALFTCMVLSETNLFTAHGLQAMRDSIAGDMGFEALRRREYRAQSVFNIPPMCRAVADGWISWSDLGIQPSEVGGFLRADRWLRSEYSKTNLDHFLKREESWSWVKSERHSVTRIQSSGLVQLRLLEKINCLDLIDRDALIRQIASVQTLSGSPPGNPRIHDWRDMRGLFFTPCWPALQDTYFSLAALEILGGLDKIDREACIEGILRVHQGKGLFTSPDSGGYNEYHIEGDARDTFAAYESLRILGALDRVKDLDKWQFRVNRRHLADDLVTWSDIEAWVCQRRLRRATEEHRRNPQSPWRSLREP